MKRWYIVTTYSGYENSVKEDLERRRVSMKLEDQIHQILVPEETEEVKDKKGKVKQKVNKLFPGYVFVEMEVGEKGVDENAWFVVRNTQKVTGFLGSSGGGAKPVPVAKDEMNQILEKLGLITKPIFEIKVGDKVELMDGSFKGTVTYVTAVNPEKNLVVVTVPLFGRDTPMDYSVDQIRKLEEF